MMTEADESAKDKETALANLRHQIIQEETLGVIWMYERAAHRAGASWDEIAATAKTAFQDKKGD